MMTIRIEADNMKELSVKVSDYIFKEINKKVLYINPDEVSIYLPENLKGRNIMIFYTDKVTMEDIR
jgi:hypothetical protein